jgi:hypothetical protein
MDLTSLLTQKKAAILDGWFDLIVASYPADALRMLKKTENRFSNPLGSTISREIETLFDALLTGVDVERVTTPLDSLLRIKAVQDFAPSEAIGFVFSLKEAIRSNLTAELQEDGLANDLVVFESRIDDLALISFDVYMKCREAIFQLKTDELKRQTHKLLERANRMGGTAQK